MERLTGLLPPRPVRFVAGGLALAALLFVSCAGSNDSASPSADKKASSTATTSAKTGSTPTSAARSAPKTQPFTGYGLYASKQYKGTRHWICHPGLSTDPCRRIDTTVIKADGSRTVLGVKRAAVKPPVDCFYVYPTTSTDPPPNSDFNVDASEIDTVRAQVASYGSACRVFAPAYRQITLRGLGGGVTPAARKLAYDDVLDAWKTYITAENRGRGVVLIGHSQGAGILAQLLKAEIDGRPQLRRHLVSAILLGTSVSVPQGKAIGGDLKHVPGCTSASQTGCLISYVSFPAAQPPAPGAFFGRSRGPGLQALCVNPVALAGGDGRADTVVPVKRSLLGAVEGLDGITTAFASLPGALTATCTQRGDYTFLAYRPAGGADRRPVAALLREQLGPNWGLHLLDANLPQDDLIQIVKREGVAYTKTR